MQSISGVVNSDGNGNDIDIDIDNRMARVMTKSGTMATTTTVAMLLILGSS